MKHVIVLLLHTRQLKSLSGTFRGQLIKISPPYPTYFLALSHLMCKLPLGLLAKATGRRPADKREERGTHAGAVSQDPQFKRHNNSQRNAPHPLVQMRSKGNLLY